MEKIKDFLRDAAIPIAGGIIGAFIGMGIAILLWNQKVSNKPLDGDE